jgi:hypothetical protein
MKEYLIKFLAIIGIVLIDALVIMLAWDMSISNLFGLPDCSFINALGLVLLVLSTKNLIKE